MKNRFVPASVLALSMVFIGCDSKSAPPAPATGDSAPSSQPPAPAAGHGGEVIPLGEQEVNGIKIKASRDKGEIKAGGDAPIDIWLDGGLGNAETVRFWIGTEDGTRFVKAKAAVEDGKWHTHAEVPNPLPADSKLWVEIDGKDGKKTTASFDLKQ